MTVGTFGFIAISVSEEVMVRSSLNDSRLSDNLEDAQGDAPVQGWL